MGLGSGEMVSPNLLIVSDPQVFICYNFHRFMLMLMSENDPLEIVRQMAERGITLVRKSPDRIHPSGVDTICDLSYPVRCCV